MSLNVLLLFREQEQNITWPTDNSQRWGENESKVCHIKKKKKKSSLKLTIGSVQILPFVERILSGSEWNKINIYKVNQMICWLTEQAINPEQVLALVLNTMFNKFFSSLVSLIA